MYRKERYGMKIDKGYALLMIGLVALLTAFVAGYYFGGA